jgi:hypothetical protein
MESVFEGLADAVLCLAGRFDFDEVGRLGGRMAEGKVGAAFTGLVLRLDQGWVIRIPAQLPKDRQDDALGDCLFVGKLALP